MNERRHKGTKAQRHEAPGRARRLRAFAPVCPRASARGFTIVEAVIAVVILALAIPPMVWSLREAHVKRVDPMLATQARWLAAERIEDVIADRHSETRGWSFIASANYPAESSVPDFPAFSRSVQIVETGPDLAAPVAGGGYKRITVRVQWTGAGGSPRTLELETVLTEF